RLVSWLQFSSSFLQFRFVHDRLLFSVSDTPRRAATNTRLLAFHQPFYRVAIQMPGASGAVRGHVRSSLCWLHPAVRSADGAPHSSTTKLRIHAAALIRHSARINAQGALIIITQVAPIGVAQNLLAPFKESQPLPETTHVHPAV